ncbi:MAG: BatD family protein [Lentisphaerota bacterium]
MSIMSIMPSSTAFAQPVSVTVRSDCDRILVDDPFRITFAIAIAPIQPPYHDIEPIHINRPPRIEADFLNIADIKGLQQSDIRPVLESRARAASGRQPSFLINNYADYFRYPIRFRLDPVRENRGGTNFWVYALTLNYTPLAEGDYTFGPMTFTGTVITGVTSDQKARIEEIVAVAPAVTVRVTPPPETGRPAWFIGAVGSNLTAHAGFDTGVCKVGDPLTLTLDLTGGVSLSNLRPPLLAMQEELTRDFRIYDDNVTTTTIESGKRFTWRVRPIHSGTLEFPPIRVACYNKALKTYQTVLTQPIPIQARATTQVVSDAPDTAGSASLFLHSDNIPMPAAATLADAPSPLLPPARLLLPLFLSGPAVLLLAVTGRSLWRRRGALRLARRRHRAASRARRRLADATAPDVAAAALRDYLTDRLAATGHSLTPPEASRLLIDHGVPARQADAFRALLERLDEAIYRPGADGGAAADEASALIETTETALDGRRRSGQHVSILSIVSIISIILISSPVRALETSSAFGWERANARFATARLPTDFLEAAQSYNRLVLDGDTRGALFYNLGTALLLAGDAPNAIAALDRADRRLGATPATRANLRLAYGQLDAPPATGDAPQALPLSLAPPALLPCTHMAFFWHYEFPCRHRAAAAAVGWTILFAGLLIRLFRPVAARPLVWAGLMLFAIFGTSAAITLLQEYRDSRSWPTRVFTSDGGEVAS